MVLPEIETGVSVAEGPHVRCPVARVLVIDNYDSFVYNLVQYLGELGAEPIIHRHDAIDLDDVERIDPDGILISPGPGSPADAGLSNTLIEQWSSRVPVFGVCLGMQCLGEVFGGRVIRAPEIVHGKTSLIQHTGEGLFAGLSQDFQATRYHSLVVEESTMPDVLEITARSADGEVMGVRHKHYPVVGVQFHPESILTPEGMQLLRNFIAMTPVSA